MNAREERGLVIAALCKLNKTPQGWLVPSQSGQQIYTVDPVAQTCTCPDHQDRKEKCKHIYAVEFTIKREIHADGSVTETRSITFTQKKVYKHDNAAFNAAQSVEKDRFQELLFDICRNLPEPERSCRGRKPHSTKDAVFSMAFKVYSTFSARRFSSDLREAHRRGYLSRPVPGMKVCGFMEDPDYAPLLKGLIAWSARPLRSVETDFAIDSTGFSTCKFETWYDQKYGITRRKCAWIKAHIAVGVKTNVITAVRVLDKDSADSPQFPVLVKKTAENFTIREMSADKAYSSLEAFELVNACGGTAFIPFKSNATGGVGGLFEKMFHYFQFKNEEYMDHYHKRSNIESTNSMVKRKFGDHLRSRTDDAMVNECLCKLLCHNLCVLIQEQHELGIEPIFWPENPSNAALTMTQPE